LQTLRVIST